MVSCHHVDESPIITYCVVLCMYEIYVKPLQCVFRFMKIFPSCCRTHERYKRAWCKSGTRSPGPGPQDPETRDPGPPSKFKSGTLGATP